MGESKNVETKLNLKILRMWLRGIGLPIIFIILRASHMGWAPWSIICGVFVVLIWVLNSIWAAILANQLARSRHWGLSLLVSILPAIFVITISTLPQAIGMISDLGDGVHFLAERHSYLTKIANVPQTGQPKLIMLDLDGVFSMNAIVYDESDEIVLPAERRSNSWKARAEKNLICVPSARAFLTFSGLTKHFYLTSFSC